MQKFFSSISGLIIAGFSLWLIITYINNDRFYEHIKGQSESRTIPLLFNWVNSEVEFCRETRDTNNCIDYVYDIISDNDISNYYYITSIKLFNEEYSRVWPNPNSIDQTVKTHIYIDLSSDITTLNFEIDKSSYAIWMSVYKSITFSISDYSKVDNLSSFIMHYAIPRSAPSYQYFFIIMLLGFFIFKWSIYKEKILLNEINTKERIILDLSSELGEVNFNLTKIDYELEQANVKINSANEESANLIKKIELLNNDKKVLEEEAIFKTEQLQEAEKFINSKRVMIGRRTNDDWESILQGLDLINSNTLIFVDTCSLMWDNADIFFSKTMSSFLMENKLIIPYKVNYELNGLQNHPRKKHKVIKAKEIIKDLKKNSKAVIKGRAADFADQRTADNSFQMLFVKFREEYELKLITQDHRLAFDILLLNESRSAKFDNYGKQKIKDISVYRIGVNGTKIEQATLPSKNLQYNSKDKPDWKEI